MTRDVYYNGARYHIETRTVDAVLAPGIKWHGVQIWTYAPLSERDLANGYQFPVTYRYRGWYLPVTVCCHVDVCHAADTPCADSSGMHSDNEECL